MYLRPYIYTWYYSNCHGRAFGQIYEQNSALGWKSVDRVQFYLYNTRTRFPLGICSCPSLAPQYILMMCLFSLFFYSQTINTFLQNRRNPWKRPSNLPLMQMWGRIASPYLPLVQSSWQYPQACDWTTQYVRHNYYTMFKMWRSLAPVISNTTYQIR